MSHNREATKKNIFFMAGPVIFSYKGEGGGGRGCCHEGFFVLQFKFKNILLLTTYRNMDICYKIIKIINKIINYSKLMDNISKYLWYS